MFNYEKYILYKTIKKNTSFKRYLENREFPNKWRSVSVKPVPKEVRYHLE